MGAQLGQAGWVQTKIVASAEAFFLDQARRFQYSQMLRHGRPAYGQPRSQIADRGRALTQQIEHGLAGRVRERAEQLLPVSHALQ